MSVTDLSGDDHSVRIKLIKDAPDDEVHRKERNPSLLGSARITLTLKLNLWLISDVNLNGSR